MAKFTYEFVKAEFSKRGYSLLSPYYKNTDKPLECVCPVGHHILLSLHSLRNDHGCRICSERKPCIDDVRKLFLEKGLEMVSEEYVNAKTPLEYRCIKCGNTGKVLVSNVRRKKTKGCAKCYFASKRPSEIFVKKELEEVGFDFLYLVLDSITRVGFVCDKGHKIETEWSSFFRREKRCPECNKSVLRSIDEVREVVSKEGYELISNEYLGNKSKIVLKCPKGHKYKTRFNYFQQNCRCPECGREKSRRISESRRVSTKHIQECFEKEGYTIVDMEYKDARSPIKYICSAGHEGATCWNVFQAGHRCSVCSRGSVSKSSQKWLDSLGITQENREVWLPELGIRVDGHDPETNTVYEFLGDYWHGNPNVYDQDEANLSVKKTFGQLYKETIERLFLLRQSGYNLNVIWEEDFNKWHK